MENKRHRLKEVFTARGPKSERGFNNYDCARMLVGLKQSEEFNKDPECVSFLSYCAYHTQSCRRAFMKAVEEGTDPTYFPKAKNWCTFLYPPNTKYAPGKVNGLFEGYMVVRVRPPFVC